MADDMLRKASTFLCRRPSPVFFLPLISSRVRLLIIVCTWASIGVLDQKIIALIIRGLTTRRGYY
jgi:hypothetical protein